MLPSRQQTRLMLDGKHGTLPRFTADTTPSTAPRHRNIHNENKTISATKNAVQF